VLDYAPAAIALLRDRLARADLGATVADPSDDLSLHPHLIIRRETETMCI
jgi:hypothetical protein